ncbi:hypothetical protein ACQE3D_25355 (plasmid) [Methylomonas sp. MS20]|uniref:hypothetical protein n=1 Tax=Methylomonas sp. MS20 TaxID=3418769 RepID=UPI003CFC2476
MKIAKNTLLGKSYIAHVDDERDIDNGIIVTLAKNWYFCADPGCGVRGFDNWPDALNGCKKSEVYKKVASPAK